MKKLVSALFLIFSLNLFASSSEIEIQHPIIRLPPPGATISAMFLKIINHSNKDLKLVKVSGDFAGSFELHNMEMIDGKMKMRAVDSIELKKNSTTELKSGGLHIMIFDTKSPLKSGDVHKLNLTLDDKSVIEVDAKVEKMN